MSVIIELQLAEGLIDPLADLIEMGYGGRDVDAVAVFVVVDFVDIRMAG